MTLDNNLQNQTNNIRIAKLQQAKIARLGNTSPRTRGDEKTQDAVEWIYRWGWASPSTLDLVTASKRSGLAARLVKKALLKSTRTEAGGAKGIPNFVLTLTEQGLELAEKHTEDLIKYEIDPYKIDQTKLRHDEISQRFCARALLDKTAIQCKSPHELASRSAKDVKQPDAILIDSDNKKLALEIELTAKWDRKLDQFVHSCLLSMKNGSPNHVDHLILVSDSNAILKRYKEAFAPGATLNKWQKNERGFWSIDKTITIPDWHWNRISWIKLDL